MNYKEIENLAMLAKLGDISAKENLVKEFTPLILNLSKKSFISSYEFEDVKNECYKTLFKCVNVYNPERHRFVAYATNAIKNSVNHLIRVSVRRNSAEGKDAYELFGKLENMLSSDMEHIDDIIINGANKVKLKYAIKNLDFSEQELITYIFFEGYSLKNYAELKGISYSSAFSKKTSILSKLKKTLNGGSKGIYLN